MKSTSTQRDQKIIEILKELGSHSAEYPFELMAARRAAFKDQINERRNLGVKEALPGPDDGIIERLAGLKSLEPEYPAELLATTRAAYVDRVLQLGELGASEVLAAQDEKLAALLQNLKSERVEYPPSLLAARRAAFVRRAAGWGGLSILDAVGASIQGFMGFIAAAAVAPSMNRLRTSLIIASVVAATVLGSFMGRRPLLQGAIGNSPPGINVSRPVVSAETSAPDAASTICKPGYVPPSCLAMRFDKTGDLTFRGNGARPAVAKDTLPGYSGIHNAAFVNDGLYGHGASWISNSPYSWIKIDLGQATTINTVTFGRDRLGNFNDRDPGQFVIAVAMSDDIYADGNSSNDGIEYIQVYDSKGAGFTGTVSGAETVTAQFGSVVARYVKITFENPGTAIDEVEVFMVQPVFAIGEPTDRPDNRPPRPTSTPVPSNTPRPTSTYTLTPTNTPTDTPVPTSTPTNTPIPTNTPTNTPVPTHTPSNTPAPTNTPVPTSTPQPTATPSPFPTSTPRPPNTPTPLPSGTPVAQATP